MPCHNLHDMTDQPNYILYYLRYSTPFTEWYLLIDIILSSKHRRAYAYVYQVCICIFLPANLHQGGIIISHSLFKKHEEFVCQCHTFSDDRSCLGIFGPFMSLVAHVFCQAIFGCAINTSTVASGIYLPTLI